jgi:hypothetical protein
LGGYDVIFAEVFYVLNLNDLFKDAEFVKELTKANSTKEAQKIIKSRGVDVSTDELNAIRDEILKKAESNVDESELALVAGGMVDIERSIDPNPITSKSIKPIFRGGGDIISIDDPPLTAFTNW